VAARNSPLIAQYLSVKQKVPDAILFFRLGDFYEMMFEDAEVGARVLDIQLTSRSKDGVPLCGVPYHSAEPYIAKLLKAGLKVAICEQTPPESRPRPSQTPRTPGAEEPFQLSPLPSRGLMPRQIVRVITPGTVGEETVLTAGEKSFLLALAAGTAGETGFAMVAIDVSTGEFLATRIAGELALREEIARVAPREIIAPKDNSLLAGVLGGIDCPVTWLEPSAFSAPPAREMLAQRFGAEVTGALGPMLGDTAGAALLYVEETFGRELAHLRPPHLYRAAEYMLVDEVSRRHLELVSSSDGTRRGSLLSVLDETLTPIGARVLQKWIIYPLLDLTEICSRHDAVEELFERDLGGAVAQALRQIGDLERLAGRVGSLRASPRDCLKLEQALRGVATLRAALEPCRSLLIRGIVGRLVAMPELVARIDAAIAEEPPVNPRDGNVIRTGFSPEVDDLRALASDARGVIARLEASERERSRIPSLKVRYNQIFGYYIEVTKPNLDRVPADYERKQTLVNAERFTTPALRELERKILGAESGLKELELGLFTSLLRDLAIHAGSFLETAAAVGEFDALLALAMVARRRGYVRPRMNSGLALSIRDGRHPVLETGMRAGEFVPNDVQADSDDRQLLLITGPNMAGKSTYLRQVALIVIMAQMGSFVPATEATLGLVERVLTRIGARDDLRRGESTFMVEMRETARLLMGLDDRSLLLLDEVGRGTSTFDGLAIAWALAEHLHDHTRAKVLFATHFHELTDLARERPRVKNLSMAVREWNDEVLFLRRVIEQPASRSYGIEVARLAGLPENVIGRARQILANLEMGELNEAGQARLAHREAQGGAGQLGLFTASERRTLDELKELEVEHLTPVDALNVLARTVQRLKRSEN
jgi:DNA mismatch repair protein MutS